MLLQLQNGCEDQRTLDLYNKFIYSPHCITGVMYPVYDDEGVITEEVVEITFNHYIEVITVVFKVDTDEGESLGEVFLHEVDTIGKEGDLDGSEELTEDGVQEAMMHCGVITESRLVELLKSLPHIRNFMEDEVGDGVLH